MLSYADHMAHLGLAPSPKLDRIECSLVSARQAFDRHLRIVTPEIGQAMESLGGHPDQMERMRNMGKHRIEFALIAGLMVIGVLAALV